MLNQVVLVGRLTDDPKVTTTENGKKVTSIVVAVQRTFKSSTGLYESDFVRCTLWNNMASNISEYCKKGDVVGLKGRIETGEYIDKDENKKYYTEVIAEKVTYISNNKTKEPKVTKKAKDKE